MAQQANIYLGLGSNLGDRHAMLLSAIERLIVRVGPLVRCSSLIETAPMGFESEHAFMNAVAHFHTTLTPRELLEATQSIERELGRQHKSINGHYTDRPIDIDILLYDDLQVDEPDLKIPHPRMKERPFVMQPLNEVLSFKERTFIF